MPKAVPRASRTAGPRLHRLRAVLRRYGLTAYAVPLAAAAVLVAVQAGLVPLPGERAAGPAPASVPSATPSRPIVGTAARAIDGDTLELAGQRIRLHGIDAPETQQVCQRRGQPYDCGREAQRRLASALAGREVRCVVRGRDGYDRLLAVCHAGGVDLGEAMVRNSWAVAYRRYSDDYVGAERDARARGGGLWGGGFEAPEQWRHRGAGG